jgi:hypothetical protein
MPTLSIFYGIKVIMYFIDNKEHNTPHIHAKYAEYTVVIDIERNEVIVGDFPRKKLKLLQTWVDLHQEELMANWDLASTGQATSKIEPLK